MSGVSPASAAAARVVMAEQATREWFVVTAITSSQTDVDCWLGLLRDHLDVLCDEPLVLPPHVYAGVLGRLLAVAARSVNAPRLQARTAANMCVVVVRSRRDRSRRALPRVHRTHDARGFTYQRADSACSLVVCAEVALDATSTAQRDEQRCVVQREGDGPIDVEVFLQTILGMTRWVSVCSLRRDGIRCLVTRRR
jgi:hypothetical protein